MREAEGALLRLADRLARLAPTRGRLSEVEQNAVAADVFCDGPGELSPYLARLTVLTALSTVIAALGLIGNSPAVVIGAMLVAPLMQPIIGLAAALVLARPRNELLSLALIVLTTAEAFVVALIVGFAVPVFRVITLTPELLGRTAPALLDLGIAGAAGAYATVRPRAGGAIAGVAIAVALVPPLGACGVLLAHGNTGLAAGAFFLFLTNLVGIVLAAVGVFLATGFVRRKQMSRTRKVAIAIPIVVVLAVAYPLAQRSLRSYRLSSDEAEVRSLILPRLRAAGFGIQSLTVIHQAGRVVASIDVSGPDPPPAVDPLAQQLAERLKHPARIILRWTRRQELLADSTATG